MSQGLDFGKRRRLLRAALWLPLIGGALTYLSPVTVIAQQFTLYDAGSGEVVSDPGDWGWQLQGFVAGETVVAGVPNDAGAGLHAWRIDDSGAALNMPLYTTCLTFDVAGCGFGPVPEVQNGWRFASRARFVTDHNTGSNGDGSMGLNLWIDNKGYYVLFDLSSSNLRGIVYSGAANQEDRHVLTSGGTGTAAYHDIALVYNPVSQLVWFEFDGATIDSTFAQPTAGHANTLAFGNLGQDRGGMNFRNITFTVSLPGDYNRDDVVDAADYTVWRNRLGTNYGPADGNGNGTVDEADYSIWRRNYGNAIIAGSGGVAIVPEPTHLAAWLVVAVAILLDFRRRNHSPPVATARGSVEFGHGRVRQSRDCGRGNDRRIDRSRAA